MSKTQSRREFFRRLGRYAALGALATAGVLLGRRKGSSQDGGQCINKSVCSTCGVFSSCKLPAAISAKQAGLRPSGTADLKSASSGPRDPAERRPGNED